MVHEKNIARFWIKATKQSSMPGVDVKLNDASNSESMQFMLAKFLMFMCQLMHPNHIYLSFGSFAAPYYGYDFEQS